MVTRGWSRLRCGSVIGGKSIDADTKHLRLPSDSCPITARKVGDTDPSTALALRTLISKGREYGYFLPGFHWTTVASFTFSRPLHLDGGAFLHLPTGTGTLAQLPEARSHDAHCHARWLRLPGSQERSGLGGCH